MFDVPVERYLAWVRAGLQGLAPQGDFQIVSQIGSPHRLVNRRDRQTAFESSG